MIEEQENIYEDDIGHTDNAIDFEEPIPEKAEEPYTQELQHVLSKEAGAVEHLLQVAGLNSLQSLEFFKNHEKELMGEIQPHLDLKTKEELLQKVNGLISELHLEAESILAGKFVSLQQKERYRVKYKIAKMVLKDTDYVSEYKSGTSLTAEEAIRQATMILKLSKPAGMALNAYAKLIIDTGDNWNFHLDSFYMLVDTLRTSMKKYVETYDAPKIEKAIGAIESFKSLSKDKDPEGVFALAVETLKGI